MVFFVFTYVSQTQQTLEMWIDLLSSDWEDKAITSALKFYLRCVRNDLSIFLMD